MVGGFAIYYIEYGTTKQCALWPIASSMVFAIAPYTLTGMMPLNYQLLDTEACIKKGEVYSTSIIKDAFKKWGRFILKGNFFFCQLIPLQDVASRTFGTAINPWPILLPALLLCLVVVPNPVCPALTFLLVFLFFPLFLLKGNLGSRKRHFYKLQRGAIYTFVDIG